MKNAVTEKLIATINKAVKPAPGADETAFLRDFYHRLSGQDFAPERALEFRAAALRQRKLGQTRAPGESLIEIYNLGDARHSAAGDERAATLVSIITDDKPFIIDSLTIKLNALRKTPQRTLHPIFRVRRDRRHRLQTMSRYKGGVEDGDDEGEQGALESHIQFALDFTPPGEHARLRRELLGVLADIEIVVADWAKMRANALSLADTLAARKQGPAFAEHGELLRWMENHNFAFLGYAEVEVAADGRTELVAKSALGVLRAAERSAGSGERGGDGQSEVLNILPPPAASKTSPVIFTKSRQRSGIHRANYFDCILVDHAFQRGAPKTSSQRQPRRLSCILGFLAGSSALLPTAAIPHLRNKTAYILKESTLRPGGYAYKALHSILETLPREKLFQMDTRSLYALCMTILNHLERRKTRLHLHRNICGHFYSCLVYIPRDLFHSTLRQRIQAFLGEQLGADEVSFNAHFSDSILTRIHYLIHCRYDEPQPQRKVDTAELERAVQAMARDWNDNLHESIRQQSGFDTANRALELYRDAFPGSYRDEFSVAQAVIDIGRFELAQPGKIHAVLTHRERVNIGRLAQSGPGKVHAKLSHRERERFSENENKNHSRGDGNGNGERARRSVSFKVYSGESIALSDVLPILENMSVRVLGERPYSIRRRDGATCWLHDFEIVRHDRREFDLGGGAENFQSTFTHAWQQSIENDGFNQLTLLAGLDWKQVSLLRAYYRYLKQIRLRYSEHYIVESLANNPELVVSLTALFDARFNPSRKSAARAVSKIKTAIATQLEQVATLDEDRILRALLDVIHATLRTNYYQPDKPYLALKLNARAIPRIPEPAPEYEIFVYSPRVEGVHLRGGKVARGGLRWSERPEDFRTEVLGLVKAQRVKNAVIVPVGSKGGFVAKRLPESGRDAIQREVVACYRLFISALLDLTDNLSGRKVIPPKDVVRIDGDDPYLVVAADKGTATFSDIANGISEDYNFWLGDAFASGGSAGYDHKKMGITARGAWESVKRHFRERGKDIQTTDFTVAGIGDMAGDVFGNGMLLSKHIRLLAAFNHRHIFIDPSPDAAASYCERRRLFDLPRSSWDDYNRAVISTGGGVYERSAKSISLSKQAQKTLGAGRAQYAPDDLINLILKSDVELLWNGGIGTYVKASSEPHAAAQDKSNDGVRVNANQLRCKVIGEGGNLGMTQAARIEYALGGGLCYTDAIDNSAGVDTSDHEVNIKILLNAAIQRRQLAPAQRNRLLARMEDEVGALVLRNNYAQAQALSIEAARAKTQMPQQSRAIDALADKGLLQRDIEFLPDSAALEERFEAGKWLTRPELAVLLSYSKMDLCQALMDSDVPDDAYLAVEIDRYFPPRLAKKYPRLVRAHRLKREIIATQVTNDLVGAMGPGFHLRLAVLTGCDAAQITRAYLAARDILDTPRARAGIESLDNQVDARLQLDMLEQTAAATHQCAAWLLHNRAEPLNIATAVAAFRPPCGTLKSRLNKTLPPGALAALSKRAAKLGAGGVPAALANHIAALPALGFALDIADLSARSGRPLAHTAAVYFRIRETLGIDWLARAIDALPAGNDWHERARFALNNDLRAAHTAVAAKALAGGNDWHETNRPAIQHLTQLTTQLKTEPAPDFAMLSVLLVELQRLR